MKQKSLFLLFTLILINQALSQENKCDCLANLNKLVTKTEENYAGFPSKVNDNTKVDYQALIKVLQQKASNEQNPKTCFYILKEYVRFYRDKHFILNYVNEKDHDNEKVVYSTSYFKNAVTKKQLAAIEGIWINPDTSLKLAIKKFPGNVYKAIVIESKNPQLFRGLVYVTFTPTKNGFIAKYFNSFGTNDIPAKQKGNLLQIWNFSIFGKIYPGKLTSAEQNELNTWKNSNNGLDFQHLSAKTAYLKIPSFFNNEDKIQQLINKNDSVIRTTENLIVDLTGNGGGNTGWVSFLPYLYDKSHFSSKFLREGNARKCKIKVGRPRTLCKESNSR